MVWTELTKKAYLIACHAHSGQSDKSGKPYIIHPCTVAAQMPTEEATAVALLHDVLEDSYLTEETLLLFLPKGIVQSVVFLTRQPGVSYMDYIRSIRQDPVAILVKRADLAHNMDLSRLGHPPTSQDISRQNRYRKALEILESSSLS